LQQLKDQINKGIPIIGAGAGTGISAKFEEAGGVDLIVLYNSGRFRMAGRGSLSGLLPFADANAIVLDMANEVLPVSFNGFLVKKKSYSQERSSLDKLFVKSSNFYFFFIFFK
jgi:predicted TIM-barrel enzyme